MQRQRTKKSQASGEKERELMMEIETLKTDLKQKQSLHVQHEKENSEWDIRYENQLYNGNILVIYLLCLLC